VGTTKVLNRIDIRASEPPVADAIPRPVPVLLREGEASARGVSGDAGGFSSFSDMVGVRFGVLEASFGVILERWFLMGLRLHTL
jgi:hypothetical protein